MNWLLIVLAVSSCWPVASLAAGATLFQQTTIATGKGPRYIVAVDVDRDRKRDLLVANAEGASVTVLLGNGRGGFTTTKDSPILAGHLPNDIATADLNHDGNLDMVIANHQSPYLTILLGDGHGGFRPAPGSPFDVHSRPHPHGVAVGPFFANKRFGVVTDSWGNNQIELLEVNADGGLRTPGRFFQVGRRPYERLRAADFNRDGLPDVVTTNLDDDTVTVLLGDGMGGLHEAKGSPVSAGAKPWQVAIDDLNGDGKSDLAIIPYERDLSDPKANVVTLLLGDGEGGFNLGSPSLSLQGCHGPCSIATGDIDGDGHRDIAVACAESKNVALFYGRGEGKYERVLLPSGGGWGAIALADLNGDGKDDLIAANYDAGNITIFLTR